MNSQRQARPQEEAGLGSCDVNTTSEPQRLAGEPPLIKRLSEARARGQERGEGRWRTARVGCKERSSSFNPISSLASVLSLSLFLGRFQPFLSLILIDMHCM